VNKIERVQATLAGEPVDRPPFCIWYHFGNQHASPEWTARAHLEFFAFYDLDLLKVMNDYDYPLPEGMDVMATPGDLECLTRLDMTRTPMGRQLQAIELIAKALRGTALLVDTVFNAWNTLRRNLVKEAMEPLMANHPQALEAALQVVNDNLIQYALATLEHGAAGIFLSVPASAEILTPEQYARFMRPFDLQLLQAVRGKGECHILHAHGEKVYLDQLLDYPVHALSWADLNGGPSIAEARGRTPLTLVAGLDHVRFPDLSAALIRAQVKSARAQAGNTRFVLAPGCSVPTYSYPPLIRAAREAARA
jgi:uroporphyrinogen decarboxylase